MSVSKKQQKNARKLLNGPTHLGMGRSPAAALPAEVSVDMVYQDRFNLATSSGVAGTQVFQANSIYDPDFTNVGHQPMYRDQWAAIYQRYKVVTCKAEWSLAPLNSNSGQFTYVVYNQAPPTALPEVAEFACRLPTPFCPNQTESGAVVISIAQTLGISEREYLASDSLWSTMGLNPARQVFLSFGCHPSYAGATDTNVAFSVLLTYRVRLSQPMDPGTS